MIEHSLNYNCLTNTKSNIKTNRQLVELKPRCAQLIKVNNEVNS